jgi:hypothetical protein
MDVRRGKQGLNFWAGTLILAAFGTYALWNARDLLGGSALAATSPEIVRGDVPVATLAGSVSRASTHLTVNGLPTLADERGYWEGDYLLRPGRNVFLIEAHDRFGNVEAVERVVWYLSEEA